MEGETTPPRPRRKTGTEAPPKVLRSPQKDTETGEEVCSFSATTPTDSPLSTFSTKKCDTGRPETPLSQVVDFPRNPPSSSPPPAPRKAYPKRSVRKLKSEGVVRRLDFEGL